MVACAPSSITVARKPAGSQTNSAKAFITDKLAVALRTSRACSRGSLTKTGRGMLGAVVPRATATEFQNCGRRKIWTTTRGLDHDASIWTTTRGLDHDASIWTTTLRFGPRR